MIIYVLYSYEQNSKENGTKQTIRLRALTLSIQTSYHMLLDIWIYSRHHYVHILTKTYFVHYIHEVKNPEEIFTVVTIGATYGGGKGGEYMSSPPTNLDIVTIFFHYVNSL